MSYTITISGHVGSAKQEAEVLAAAADFVEKVEANGSFGFVGMHLSVAAGAPGDAVKAARDAVAAYNAKADADDQADADDGSDRA
jgi:hypothetical protein